MIRGLATDEQGQATVEFALIMPVLLLMVIGIIEIGRGWNVHQVLTDAAREGARTAVVANGNYTTSTVDSTVRNALVRAALNGYGPNTLVTLTGWRVVNGSATVRVQYPYRFMFLGPLMNWTTGQRTINMVTEATMRNE